MNRTTVVIILAIVAVICALAVLMDVREPVNLLAGAVIALAISLVLVTTP